MHKLRPKRTKSKNTFNVRKGITRISTFFGSCHYARHSQKKNHFCWFNLSWKRKKWIPNIVCWCITQKYYTFSLLSHTFRCDIERKKKRKNRINIDYSIEREWKNWHAKSEKIKLKKICACEYRIKWQKEEEEGKNNNNKISYKKKDIERVETWSDYVNNISHSSRRRTHTHRNKPNRKRGDFVSELRACDFHD